MKKALSLILALVLCLSLCACGGKRSSEKMTPEEAVVDSAEWKVKFDLYNRGYKVAPNIQTSIKEVDENKFEFSGTYSAKNEFGELIKGTFKGTGTYYPETESASTVVDMD